MPAPPPPSAVPPPRVHSVQLPRSTGAALQGANAVKNKAEEEERKKRIERRRRSLKIYLALIIVLGIGLMAMGINLSDEEGSGTGNTFALLIGIVGAFVMFTGIAGYFLMKHLRGLLVYFIFLLLEAILLFVFGGVCFFLRQNVAVNFAKEETFIMGELDSEGDVSTRLIILGIAAIVTACLLIRILRVVGKMVGSLRALVVLLQTMNLTLLPFGLMFMATGFFVADSSSEASSSSTDYVAIVFLAIGATVASVSFLGCLAAATFSRNMLIVYSAFISFVMSVLLAAGIASFLLTEEVESYLIDNWQDIRLAFPPTFSGRYDQKALEAWLKQNLKTMGYASFIFGVYCCSMLITAFNLRNRFMDADNDGGDRLSKKRRSVTRMIEALGGTQQVEYIENHSNGAMSTSSNSSSTMRGRRQSFSEVLKRKWTDRWTKSTPSERRRFRLAGLCLCLTLLVPLILGMTLLMYDAFCESVSAYRIDYNKTVQNLENINTISIAQMYSSGHTKVVMDKRVTNKFGGASLIVEGNVSASKEAYASGKGCITSQAAGTVLFDLIPAAPSTIMGQDVSCQIGKMEAYLNPASFAPTQLRNLRVSTASHITIAFPVPATASDIVYFNKLDLKSREGTIIAERLNVGAGGSTFRNYNGSIEISSMIATGSIGTSSSSMDLETDVGGISIDDLTLTNTRLRLLSLSGPVRLTDISSSTSGSVSIDSEIHIVGKRGAVAIERVEADKIFVSTIQGMIRASGIVVGTSFKAGTVGGAISITGITPNKNSFVQIESETGSIAVAIKLDAGFFGRYELSTSTGSTICVVGSAPGLFKPDDGSDIVDSNDNSKSCITASSERSESGTINEDGETRNAAYGGEIQITSTEGNIELRILKEN